MAKNSNLLPVGMEAYEDDALLQAHDAMQSVELSDIQAPAPKWVDTPYGSVRRYDINPLEAERDDSLIVVDINPMANDADPQHITRARAIQALVGPHRLIMIPQNNVRLHNFEDFSRVAKGDFSPVAERYLYLLDDILPRYRVLFTGGSLGAAESASLGSVIQTGDFADVAGFALAEPVNIVERKLSQLNKEFKISMPMQKVKEAAHTADVPALDEYWDGQSKIHETLFALKSIRLANIAKVLGLTHAGFIQDIIPAASTVRRGRVVLHRDVNSLLVPQEPFDAVINDLTNAAVDVKSVVTQAEAHAVIDNPWLMATLARLAVSRVDSL